MFYVFFLLCDSPAPELYVPTLRNALPVPSSQAAQAGRIAGMIFWSIKNSRKIVKKGKGVALFRDGDDTFRCRWYSPLFHSLWDLVLVIFPGGKRYAYIRAGLSRREVSGIVTGRELFFTSNGTFIERKTDDLRRRERRSKPLLDNIQEARSYRKLKETLDRTLRRTRMEKRYESVVLQTT